MPAARYWRAIGLQSVGGGALELSAFHLYLNGSRVDTGATLTSTVAPTSGSLANLQDTDTSTVCRWADTSARGFELRWDFGAGVMQDVSAVRLGSGSLRTEFLERVTLQSSADGVAWASLGTTVGLGWPGANVQQTIDGDVSAVNVVALLPFDGVNGATSTVDKSPAPKAVTFSGTARISTAQSKWGGASLRLDGSSGYVEIANVPGVASTDFCVEGWVRPDALGAQSIFGLGMDSYGYAAVNVQLTASGKWYMLYSYNGSDWGSVVEVGSYTAASWNFFRVIRAGNSLSLYVNGALAQSAALTGSLMASALPFIIGRSRSAISNHLAGYIDDFLLTIGDSRSALAGTVPSAAFPTFDPIPLRLNSAAQAIQLSGGASAQAGLVLPPQALRLDLQDFGPYRIYGTVKKKATQAPLRRCVQLYNQRDRRLVRETWSDAITGEYSFDHIRGGDGTRYLVMAFDHTGMHRGLIADEILPEAM